MNCTLCQTLLHTKIDNDYYHCPTCNAYLKDEMLYFSKEKEKQHYEFHNNDVNDIGYQRFTSPITNHILKTCTTEMLGLDYGCGKGPVITKQLLDKNYQVNLYDLYFHPSLDYLNYQYDYIFSSEVFEHFYQPYEEIKKLTNLLITGGRLLVMTHLYQNQQHFDKWYYRKDQTHVFIYTPKTVRYIAKHFGYKIEILSERLFVLVKD
ncbi:methyltransferase domain-containing protein [Myroides injenensis]|uniref:methyltransferase domain-containing protein n=1 Tax=Myroides injenensis TaxID=1183151 RepID=UPI0004752E56|nr:methyltransferase domain-containing protein [Myroides injenensis]